MGVVAGSALFATACQPAGDALTAHSQTAAEAAGYRLNSAELGQLMAEADYLPVDSISPELAESIAQLWADYIRLSVLYQEADSTLALDFEPLLERLRYFDQLSVFRFRDSVLEGEGEVSEAELRAFYEARQPYTRLDVRRISISVPVDASEAVRDSVYELARRVQRLAQGGAEFPELAREWSDEPPEARGQLLSYQGHDQFGPAADSVVFRVRPGEVSPVIPTPDAMLIYRVERRRAPSFEEAQDRAERLMVDEQVKNRARQVTDSLFEHARVQVMKGAGERARSIAANPFEVNLRRERRDRLVTYEDGEITSEEVRDVMLLRPDIARMFVEASDEDAESLLGELAHDEIMARAAERAGFELSPVERDSLSVLMASQLSALAAQFEVYHNVVTSPLWNMQQQGIGFLAAVLESQTPTPMLSYGYREILDGSYSENIDDRGVQAAVRQAQRLREASPVEADRPGEPTAGEEAAATGGEEDGEGADSSAGDGVDAAEEASDEAVHAAPDGAAEDGV